MTLITWVSLVSWKFPQNPKTGGFFFIVKMVSEVFVILEKFQKTIATEGFLISKLFKSSKQEVVNKNQSTTHKTTEEKKSYECHNDSVCLEEELMQSSFISCTYQIFPNPSPQKRVATT